MTTRLEEVRLAVAALGLRARTTRVPDEVRRKIAPYVRAQRARGRSWEAIAREVGFSKSGLQRWTGKGPRLRRVRVVAHRAVAPERVSLVSPQGYRIEGLSLEQALGALARLS